MVPGEAQDLPRAGKLGDLGLARVVVDPGQERDALHRVPLLPRLLRVKLGELAVDAGRRLRRRGAHVDPAGQVVIVEGHEIDQGHLHPRLDRALQDREGVRLQTGRLDRQRVLDLQRIAVTGGPRLRLRERFVAPVDARRVVQRVEFHVHVEPGDVVGVDDRLVVGRERADGTAGVGDFGAVIARALAAERQRDVAALLLELADLGLVQRRIRRLRPIPGQRAGTGRGRLQEPEVEVVRPRLRGERGDAAAGPGLEVGREDLRGPRLEGARSLRGRGRRAGLMRSRSTRRRRAAARGQGRGDGRGEGRGGEYPGSGHPTGHATPPLRRALKNNTLLRCAMPGRGTLSRQHLHVADRHRPGRRGLAARRGALARSLAPNPRYLPICQQDV